MYCKYKNIVITFLPVSETKQVESCTTLYFGYVSQISEQQNNSKSLSFEIPKYFKQIYIPLLAQFSKDRTP